MRFLWIAVTALALTGCAPQREARCACFNPDGTASCAFTEVPGAATRFAKARAC